MATDVKRVGELVGERTETSATYELSDGTFETELFAGPVHVKDDAGLWAPIDTNLLKTAAGWSPASTDVDLQLPDVASGPVRVENDQRWVEFELADDAAPAVVAAAAGEATVDGPSVTYDEVEAGVDVRLTAMPAAVKEEVVLADATATRSFSWRLGASAGLTATLTPENEVRFTAADGTLAFMVPAPFMVDASGSYDARSSDLAVTLERDGGDWVYKLVANDVWLDAPERVWPVTIDPTIVQTPLYDCTLTSGAQANTNYCGSEAMRVGRTPEGMLRRSVMNFDTSYTFREFDITPANVMAAELSVKLTADSGPRFDTSVHPTIEEWNNGATWNNRTATALWGVGAGGSMFGDPVHGSGRGIAGNASSAYWAKDPGRVYWYPTQMVQQWVDGGTRDFGFLLSARDEAVGGEMRFHSAEAADFQNYPHLRIQWSRGLGERDGYTWSDQTSVTDQSEYKVNVGTGNLYLAANDITIGGIADHNLGVDRAYNSLRRRNTTENVQNNAEFVGDFGAGWTSNLDSGGRIRMYTDQERVAYTHPSGWTESFYDRFGTNVYTSTRRTNLKIERGAFGTLIVKDEKAETAELFNLAGQLLNQTDKYQNTINYNYTNGKITSVSDTRGGGISTITRNANGLIEKITDHAGRAVSYAYSGLNLTSVTNAAGKVTKYEYGASGQLSAVVDPLLKRHEFTYLDAALAFGGAVATVKSPRLFTTKYGWTRPTLTEPVSNRKVTVTDPRNNATTYFADQRGRVSEVHDARGVKQSTTYGPSDNVINFTDRAGGTPTTNSYSEDGRSLTQASTPMGSTYKFGYSGGRAFQPDTYTSPRGNTIGYGYDTANGALNKVTDANGTMTIDRNTNGTTTKVTNQLGNATSYGYSTDGKFRLTSITPPAGARKTTVNTYDTLHRPTQVTDGNGKITKYLYDAIDRVTKVTFHDATSVVYAYDANGQRTSRTDPTGATGTAYDADGNITQETFPAPRGTITYTYDQVGNLTSMTDVNGKVSYAYGKTNLLDTITEPVSGTLTPVTRYTYEPDSSNVLTVTFPTSTPIVQTYKHDKDNKIEKVEAKQGTTVLTSHTYGYETAPASPMRKTALNGFNGQTTTYTYDTTDRIKQAATPGGTGYGYTYDAASNRKSQTVTPNGGTATATQYMYDAADQLCWSQVAATPGSTTCGTLPTGGTRYTHDAAGNMTTSTAGLDLRYNTVNQTTQLSGLTGLQKTPATYAGTTQTERVTAAGTFITSILGVTGKDAGGTKTQWIRDPGGNIVAQRTPAGSGGARAYYLTDGLGSVSAVVDAGGVVRNRYTYSPYGETTQTCHTTCITNPWKYTGEHQDATGMYKIGARTYSPDLGRWTQSDPAANRINTTNPGETNPYAYGACDPVNNTDPTGLWSWPKWTGCAVSVAGAAVGVGMAIGFAPVTIPAGAAGAALYGGTILSGGLAGAGIGISCS